MFRCRYDKINIPQKKGRQKGDDFMKYREWLDEWLENYIKPSSKERTYERYCQIVNLHIVPKLGELNIEQLTPIVLQKFVTNLLQNGNKRTGEGLSANFVNSVISIIQNSMKTAYLLGMIKIYEANKIKRPKAAEKQVECFTVAEQKKIEQAVLQSKRTQLLGIVLCLYTGLRIGELLALEWQDLDFTNGFLYVNKSCHDGNRNGCHCRVIERPKTDNSRRVIPLPKQILPILREWKKASKSNYLVAKNDKPFFVRSYQRSFELLLEKLKIPHRGFHSLRHTFATRALECGMDVKTLSEILGHKNPTITLKRYVHSLMEHKSEMMNKLGKLL